VISVVTEALTNDDLGQFNSPSMKSSTLRVTAQLAD